MGHTTPGADSEWYAASSSDEESDSSHPLPTFTPKRRTKLGRRLALRGSRMRFPQEPTPTKAPTKDLWVQPEHPARHTALGSTLPMSPLIQRTLPFLPNASPFVHHRRPTTFTARPPNPVFLRSPGSHRLKRLDRSPIVTRARKHVLSPKRKKVVQTGLERYFQRACITPQPVSNDMAWADESDSELSSVPSSPLSSEDEAHPLTLSARTHSSPSSLSSIASDNQELMPPIPNDQGFAAAHAAGLAPDAPESRPVMSHRTLLRRRRASLVRLCNERGLPVPPDATKLVLTDILAGVPQPDNISVHAAAQPPQSLTTAQESKELQGLDLERLDLLDHEISPDKLEKLEKIGSGAFKDVYKGRYHVSRTRVMDVAISDLRNELSDMDIKELTFLRDLRHENIVSFIGVSVPSQPINTPCMIVSELCEHGDLFDYIRQTPPPPDVHIFRILLQIARGLEYLHTRTPMVIHRDCKSTNVLITAQGVAKISDFGFARVKRSARAMVRSLVGTVNWQAVELWVPKPNYNEKVDVWSAAMTFWEALQWHQPEKRYPFQGMNEHQIYQHVRERRQRYVYLSTFY